MPYLVVLGLVLGSNPPPVELQCRTFHYIILSVISGQTNWTIALAGKHTGASLRITCMQKSWSAAFDLFPLFPTIMGQFAFTPATSLAVTRLRKIRLLDNLCSDEKMTGNSRKASYDPRTILICVSKFFISLTNRNNWRRHYINLYRIICRGWRVN